MKYQSVNIELLNAGNWEIWELVITEDDEFYVIFNENGFDVDISRALKGGMFDNVKWTEESSKIMLIGLFEIGLE